MLHRNPDQRQRFARSHGMIRECLLKIERRRELADRYSIPLRTTVRRPVSVGTRRFFRRTLPVAAVLLAAAVLVALLLGRADSENCALDGGAETDRAFGWRARNFPASGPEYLAGNRSRGSDVAIR